MLKVTSLCSTKHYAMKTYGGLEVYSTHSYLATASTLVLGPNSFLCSGYRGLLWRGWSGRVV